MFEQRHLENRLNGCWEDGSVGETMFSRSAPSIVSRNPAIKILLLARSKQFPKLFNFYSWTYSEAGLLLAETDVTTKALIFFPLVSLRPQNAQFPSIRPSPVFIQSQTTSCSNIHLPPSRPPEPRAQLAFGRIDLAVPQWRLQVGDNKSMKQRLRSLKLIDVLYKLQINMQIHSSIKYNWICFFFVSLHWSLLPTLLTPVFCICSIQGAITAFQYLILNCITAKLNLTP